MGVHDHDNEKLLDDLEVLPAGAPLAQVLDEVVAESVSGHDTVRLVTAAYRQLSRARALFLWMLLESGLRRPGSAESVERVDEPGEFACEEARATLAWSRSRASRQFGFAIDVFVRMPAVGAAMLTGELDEPRARAFTEWTVGLAEAHAEAVCDTLLSEAPRLTVGELIDRIKQLCLALDPGWAEQRYRHAVQRRRVTGFRNPDGTASLTGQNQPVERVAAACARIDALARTCKLAGDTRPIDHIRSDLYLGMTDGTFTGMDDRQIAAHVRDHPYSTPDDPSGGDPSAANPSSDDGPDGGGRHDGDGGGDRPDGGGSPGGSDGPGRTDDGGGVDATGGMDPADGSADADPAGVPRPEGARDPVEESRSVDAGARSDQRGPAGWSVPEVRVRLSTLLGLDEYPAEVPPWGHVPAGLARGLVAAMASAEWRYVICGPDGHARTGGLLTARPDTRDPARRDRRRGGIVEVAVATAQLAQLHTVTPTSTWAALHTEMLHLRTGDGGDQADPRRRFPTARLRRWIQIRDRVCTHPSCRAPARSADQDHRHDFCHGGTTDDTNLEPKCRHDHRLRHEGSWQTDPGPDGTTIWTSPLGHRYISRPPPVMPHLPDPLPPHPSQPLPLSDRGWLTWTPSAPCSCSNTVCTCEPPLLPPPPRRVHQQPDGDCTGPDSEPARAVPPRRHPLPPAWRGETTTLLTTDPPPF